MWMKSFGRGLIERVVNRFGYELVYSPGPETPQPPDRTVYQAYYKGHCFYCYRNDQVSEFILTGKGWDINLERQISRALEKTASRTVIEVGANIGASSIPICGQFPDVTFHMFEPVPDFFALLQKNVENYQVRNARLHNYAISDRDGAPIGIVCGRGNAGACMLLEAEHSRMTATSHTLDALFPAERIAFLKVDVDGHELGVLRGAKNLIQRSQPDVLLEFCTQIMDAMRVEPMEVLRTLNECGLTDFDIYDNVGNYIEATQSNERLIEVARTAKYYVDVVAKS